MNIPQGITVIYFNDEQRNIYANLPLCKDTAKRLSKRICKNAMTALSTEQQKNSTLLQTIYADSGIST